MRFGQSTSPCPHGQTAGYLDASGAMHCVPLFTAWPPGAMTATDTSGNGSNPTCPSGYQLAQGPELPNGAVLQCVPAAPAIVPPGAFLPDDRLFPWLLGAAVVGGLLGYLTRRKR